jgi:hypothetical protein
MPDVILSSFQNLFMPQIRRIVYSWAILVLAWGLTGCRPEASNLAPGQTAIVKNTDAKTDQHQWLYQVILESGEGIIEIPDTLDSPRVHFLLFGSHSFEPGSLILEKKEQETWTKIGDKGSILIGKPVPIGLFQGIKAVPWTVSGDVYKKGISCRFRVSREGGVNGMPDRDEYWDQIIVVKEPALAAENMAGLAEFRLIESGQFGDVLPPHVKNIRFTPGDIEKQEQKMTDPVMDLLKESPQEELTWKELKSLALPLDYQKILLAGIHDADPGYAYQNGQWFVVWPGSDSTGIQSDWQMRKDVWFAPAIRIGNEIIRPAPLSAGTRFLENENGRTLPMLIIEWNYQSPEGEEKKIIQSLFSGEMDGIPQIFVHLKLEDPGQDANLLIGHGKRANAYFWGDRSQARTFIPYFTSRPNLTKKNDYVLMDEIGSIVVHSSAPIEILHSGISEIFLEFDAENSEIYLSTPQVRTENLSRPVTGRYHQQARNKFEKKWNATLSDGACADLPSAAWNEKIDSWLSQISSITRISLDGRERLSYGSYIYCHYYFGIEEGWSTIAHALWGKGEEAKKQAMIILSEENLDKSDHHHQYRNGLSSWYAATVARLTGDKAWLEKISPALVTNGYWTINARRENEGERSLVGRGLLPRHVYGGDIATPAYSLYSSGTCLKGLLETSDIFRHAGLKELQQAALDFSREAADFKKRLIEVIHEVLDQQSSPPFLPFALELEGKAGNHEGPYERLTEDKLGNYWNLFAPLFLHLELFKYRDTELPSEWITDYAENHGGLFGGLPRFYTGLDAVYAVGYINELIERSKVDIGNRAKALAALESFMIHASSQNGHTVQEVSGFYPGRLGWKDYERVVREALWNFGMYSVESYLHGHSSFTEPLGAGAGEGLWLIRKSLMDEVKNTNGLPDGGLFLLSSVPGEWLKEGNEIKLTGFPTVYGTFDLHIKSYISSKREVHVSYNYSRSLGTDQSTGKEALAWYELDKIFLRLVPAPEDRKAGRKLKMKEPFIRYDEWTIVLPVKEKGDFIVEF